jgi:hypothetical protein
MFKKLFNNLMGNDEDANNAENNKAAQQPIQSNHEEEELEEEEDEEEYEEEDEFEFDPVTLHGTHYDVEDFEAEVKRRSEARIAEEVADDPQFSQRDKENIYYNYRRDVYAEWNNIHKGSDQIIRWENAQRNNSIGISATGQIKEDDNDPLLQPIHGISFKDYTSMNAKISQGFDPQVVCKAMGIEKPIWEEVSTLWVKRMQEDSNFKLATLMGHYFQDGANHPKLVHLKQEMSEGAANNLEKLRTDRYFYEELCGARQAAYQYGLDGAQYIVDNFGINLGDFQAVAMEWMNGQNANFDSEKLFHFQNYQEEKQKEYAAKFAADQGGNVADDVEF